jgi:hypothetical protein
MEVVKDFYPLIKNMRFMVAYEAPKLLSAGIIASEKDSDIVKKMLNTYDQIIIIQPIPKLLTAIFSSNNRWSSDKKILLGKIDDFYPLTYNERKLKSSDYYTIHHWAESWVKSFDEFKYKYFFYSIKCTEIKEQKYFTSRYSTVKKAAIKKSKSLDDDYKSIYLNHLNSLLKEYVFRKYIKVNRFTPSNLINCIRDLKLDYFSLFSFKQQLSFIIKSLLFLKPKETFTKK